MINLILNLQTILSIIIYFIIKFICSVSIPNQKYYHYIYNISIESRNLENIKWVINNKFGNYPCAFDVYIQLAKYGNKEIIEYFEVIRKKTNINFNEDQYKTLFDISYRYINLDAVKHFSNYINNKYISICVHYIFRQVNNIFSDKFIDLLKYLIIEFNHNQKIIFSANICRAGIIFIEYYYIFKNICYSGYDAIKKYWKLYKGNIGYKHFNNAIKSNDIKSVQFLFKKFKSYYHNDILITKNDIIHCIAHISIINDNFYIFKWILPYIMYGDNDINKYFNKACKNNNGKIANLILQTYNIKIFPLYKSPYFNASLTNTYETMHICIKHSGLTKKEFLSIYLDPFLKKSDSDTDDNIYEYI